MEEIIRELGMKGCEADLLRRFKSQECRVVVSEDQEFLDIATV